MNNLAYSFLLSFAPQFALCFPVAPGGNTSLQVFFCSNPGCVANVTQVFCNDELLITPITDCTDLPPPNSVCQHGGRAFVSIDTPGSCDFEGGSYIKTEKCTDQTSVCDFTSATPSSPLTTKSVQDLQTNHTRYYHSCHVIAGLVLVLLVLVLTYFYKKRQNRTNQQPTRN
ncbi:hypothetical protein Q8A73_011941 [Channa argus]|nr:hypothetical protein Q8A73_011941 [Channa argus]